MATTYVNRLGIVHWLADGIADVLGPRLVDWLADGVAARLGFVDRLGNGVADILGPRLPDRLADGVAARLGFVDRLADGVADILGPGLPDWLADGVAARLGFVDRLAYGVADILGPRLPDWLTDSVGTSSVFGFINRLADRIATFSVAGLGDVFDAIDGLGFPHWLVACFVTRVLLLFVNHFFTGFHNRVALLFTTTVIGRANTWATATQTRRTAITSICGSGNPKG